ncbi:hypothetical protein [Fibrivirga algicola]|uniref:hypothetical protein n=1 Tax=Fibrivirga algicola TaxID=2950420 RepID=UPI00286E6440|nr:hypothetical protein [Fibrivirga algicola]
MKPNPTDFSHINSWGVEADPTNESTHPRKHYTGDDHQRVNWERPAQQAATVEILHANDRPNLTAVFSMLSLPSGLRGVIQRFAFRLSESEYGHWLPLMLADWGNVVEGIIDDLSHGHVPTIFAEKGWKGD